MKKLLYFSHPYSNKEENKVDIERCIQALYDNDDIFNKFIIVSPVHCYGFMYENTEYNRGLQYCTDLLLKCDGMILVGNYEESTGCKEELRICNALGITHKLYKNIDELKDSIKTGDFINFYYNS